MVERRKYQRYVVHENTIAVCNEEVGRVLDLSAGGMAVTFIGYQGALLKEFEAVFLCRTTNTVIKNLPSLLVRKGGDKPSCLGRHIVQTIGVSFSRLSKEHSKQICQYIVGLSKVTTLSQ